MKCSRHAIISGKASNIQHATHNTQSRIVSIPSITLSSHPQNPIVTLEVNQVRKCTFNVSSLAINVMRDLLCKVRVLVAVEAHDGEGVAMRVARRRASSKDVNNATGAQLLNVRVSNRGVCY